jgi:hypothetical protein
MPVVVAVLIVKYTASILLSRGANAWIVGSAERR